MNNVLICILSRMDSKRLPGKALLEIEGQPLLGRVMDRVWDIDAEIVVCTSMDSGLIANYAEDRAIGFVIGDELDCMSRLLLAAKQYGGKTIVRVTGDNPLTDPWLMKGLIDTHHALNAQYTKPIMLPRGVRSEVIDVEWLKTRHAELTPEQRNDTEYMTNYLEAPRTITVDCGGLQGRFTVDDQKDLDRVRKIYRDFDGDPPGIPGLVDWWIDNEPHYTG